jgi:hypothetical protein
VVFFTTRRGESFTETELRQRVKAAMPKAFVPRRFVELDEMPMTTQGTIDFDRLPPAFPRGKGETVPPRTETEKKVAQAWLSVLKLPFVSVHDNFFDSGGHSLLALRVIEGLFKETSTRVSPRLMLMGTLEAVAKAIDDGGGAGRAAKTDVPPGADEQAVPPPASGLFGRLKDLVKG